MLERLDWPALAGEPLRRHEARAVGEIQLREAARPLDLADLGGEALRLADRAARYYEIVAPLQAEAGIVPPGRLQA